MSEPYSNEPMLDMYIFETTQNIEQLETLILLCEKNSSYDQESVNEIFRIMHTIKGTSSMMLFNNISTLAHSMEDLFYYIREQKPKDIDYSIVSDLVLEGIDFIKAELQKIMADEPVDGDCSHLIDNIKEFLSLIKQQNHSDIDIKKPVSNSKQQYYIAPDKSGNSLQANYFKATLFFEDGCEMENLRAYTIIHTLKELTQEVYFIPEDIMENDQTAEIIRKQGFKVYVKIDLSYDELHQLLMQTIFLKDLELVQLDNGEELNQYFKPVKRSVEEIPIKIPKIQPQESTSVSVNQNMISVNVEKLDKLMDLVGEMVIAEAMVVQNPDLVGLELNNFYKAARHLHKITSEIQDMVMSIRMVPLSTTFHKMYRIVRDMTRKLHKEVNLKLIGEETEVDKNIIEHISDPLMHLIRNTIDHGIENGDEREALGKPRAGKLILEAKNAGGDVLVIVKDDGRGLNKEKILKRAKENHLLTKPEAEMSDREIYELILLPGFSTKDSVSEFSGRGVGMDVVLKNLETIGGSVTVDSIEGRGTTITLKIPLTLAIIDGMNIKVGDSRYTIPTVAIKESFRPKETDLIKDPDGNEMIMVRGECYSILRLHEHFGVNTDIKDFSEGILIMVEQGNKSLCLFADQLLGQQQVVVKALPNYIRNFKKIEGLAGCTLLGDGSISLILDIAGLISK